MRGINLLGNCRTARVTADLRLSVSGKIVTDISGKSGEIRLSPLTDGSGRTGPAAVF